VGVRDTRSPRSAPCTCYRAPVTSVPCSVCRTVRPASRQGWNRTISRPPFHHTRRHDYSGVLCNLHLLPLSSLRSATSRLTHCGRTGNRTPATSSTGKRSATNLYNLAGVWTVGLPSHRLATFSVPGFVVPYRISPRGALGSRTQVQRSSACGFHRCRHQSVPRAD
jgi:hypothetical protein